MQHTALGRWIRQQVSAGEEGMLSLASLFVMLGFLLLFSLITNVGKVVGQKLETQNAADAVATSATVELARSMNAVTAANHLIGELTALVVIHHSLGGDELDGLSQAQSTPYDTRMALTLSYALANRYSAGATGPIGYQQVSQEVRVGATIRDCRIRLKQVMTNAYIAHAVGGLFTQLGWIPYVGPVLRALGYVIIGLAMAFEGKVQVEWATLDTLEGLARVTMPIKRGLQTLVIPGVYVYSRLEQVDGPSNAEQAATDIGTRHLAKGSLYPGFQVNPSMPQLQLPLQAEPAQFNDLSKSQLVRASTPWIQYWRIPFLRFGEQALLLARFKFFYQKWTDEFSLTIPRRLKQDSQVNLLIIPGLNLEGQGKTYEPWNDASGSQQADQLFCTVGFALRPPPRVYSYGIFRQGNPDGVAAYAQGMIYNANPQRRGAAPTGWQAVAGWDTLNWENLVPEYPGPEDHGVNPAIPTNVPEPKIHLNWQNKLVPSTRVAESIWWQQGNLGQIMRRTPPNQIPLTGTH